MSLRRQRGFSLVAAIFLIALALLIVLAAVLTLSARSRSTVQALDASRALFAAQSGIEVAVARSLTPGPGGGCAAFPLNVDIEGFNVALGCTATNVDEAPDTYAIYTLTASAQRGSFANHTFISRRVRATVTQ
jgi:MSHA biogenesis protein MshP